MYKKRSSFKINPGTVLFSRGATPKVSSPLRRFTTEFGMESEWGHRAQSTRKAVGTKTLKTAQQRDYLWEVKPSVY